MNDLELLSELLEPTLTVEECRHWASVRREAGEGREGGRRHPRRLGSHGSPESHHGATAEDGTDQYRLARCEQ